jgi:transposase
VEHYAGIDVSLERSSVCVVDATGRIVREAKVASEPEALVAFFGQLGLPLTRVGLEAGRLSQWLIWGIARQASSDPPHGHAGLPDRRRGEPV